MAKTKLGNRPKNFSMTVKFKQLDGSEGSIEVSYKYRTRTEFGLFIDALMASAKAKEKTSDKAQSAEELTPTGDQSPGAPQFSMAEIMEKTAGSNADYILDVIDGWNLDEDLNHDTAFQLADELPAAALAIMETYRVAITEGRLGN